MDTCRIFVKYCTVTSLSSFAGHGGTPNLQSGMVFRGLGAEEKQGMWGAQKGWTACGPRFGGGR